ncbi:hypothetical protein Aduo_016809 [Ancylostoma duodenale]
MKTMTCLVRKQKHISPLTQRNRLCIFLRLVGHGSYYGSMAEDLSCGKQTISTIVMEVSEAINRILRSDAFPPITRASLTETAMKTQQEYDYPRAFGFMDEKHIALRKPAHSDSACCNYKSFHSIILLAICDCDYNFISFDIGSPGRAGDAGAFRNSPIRDFFGNNDDLFLPTAASSFSRAITAAVASRIFPLSETHCLSSYESPILLLINLVVLTGWTPYGAFTLHYADQIALGRDSE